MSAIFPTLSAASDAGLEIELIRLRQRQALFDRAELIAHIGHFERSYEEGRLTACSEEYARIHDLSVDEVLAAQSSWDGVLALVHPDDRERFGQAGMDLRREKSTDIEFRILLANGDIRHVREFAVEITDEHGVARGSFGILQDVSERIKYERDLEYRDELARQTEMVTDIGHFIYDEGNHRYVYMSEGCARIYGTTPEEYIARVDSMGDDIADIVEEDRDRVAEEYQRYIDSGQDCAIEYRIRRADGAVRWVRELTTAKLRHGGRVVQTLGVMQDVTDRVRREQELLFKDTMANQAETITDIGYFLFDEIEERHLFVSPGMARIMGMGVEEYMHKVRSNGDYIGLLFEQDRELVSQTYKDALQERQDWQVEYRVVRPDGELRWIREIGKAHKISGNRVAQTIGVLQDITAQRAADEELRYKDALADQAEEITDIGHFIFDEIRQRYIFVSPGLARIHGCSGDELIDDVDSMERDMDLVHPEDREQVQAVYDRFLAGGDSWQVEYRLVRSDGEIRWIREMGKVYRINHGIPEQTIGVLQDITEQKNAEREIIEAKETLEMQVVERTRELANTVKRLQIEIEERKKIAAELDFLANHDALTGLPSLRLCKDRLGRSLAESRRNRQTSAVMFLDLDGFKEINDAHGHEFGDLVLQATAERISAEVRETDTVARMGGDEFVVILTSLPGTQVAERVAGGIVERVAQTIEINDIAVSVSASIGISLYPQNGVTAEELIRAADRAMYQVKRRGKNAFGFVDQADTLAQDLDSVQYPGD